MVDKKVLVQQIKVKNHQVLCLVHGHITINQILQTEQSVQQRQRPVRLYRSLSYAVSFPLYNLYHGFCVKSRLKVLTKNVQRTVYDSSTVPNKCWDMHVTLETAIRRRTNV